MNPLRIGLLNFECSVLQAELPVLLAFGAIWDYKSRRLFEQMDRIGEKYDGKLITGRVDYEYAPDIFTDYKIKDIPTMIIFEDGKPFMTQVGYNGPEDIDRLLHRFYGVLPY